MPAPRIEYARYRGRVRRPGRALPGARYLAGVQPSSSAVVPRAVVRRVTTAS